MDSYTYIGVHEQTLETTNVGKQNEKNIVSFPKSVWLRLTEKFLADKCGSCEMFKVFDYAYFFISNSIFELKSQSCYEVSSIFGDLGYNAMKAMKLLCIFRILRLN